MTIPQAEEEKYRRAARDINSLIAVYKTRTMAEPGGLSGHGGLTGGGGEQGRSRNERGNDRPSGPSAGNRTTDRRLPERHKGVAPRSYGQQSERFFTYAKEAKPAWIPFKLCETQHYYRLGSSSVAQKQALPFPSGKVSSPEERWKFAIYGQTPHMTERRFVKQEKRNPMRVFFYANDRLFIRTNNFNELWMC